MANVNDELTHGYARQSEFQIKEEKEMKGEWPQSTKHRTTDRQTVRQLRQRMMCCAVLREEGRRRGLVFFFKCHSKSLLICRSTSSSHSFIPPSIFLILLQTFLSFYQLRHTPPHSVHLHYQLTLPPSPSSARNSKSNTNNLAQFIYCDKKTDFKIIKNLVSFCLCQTCFFFYIEKEKRESIGASWTKLSARHSREGARPASHSVSLHLHLQRLLSILKNFLSTKIRLLFKTLSLSLSLSRSLALVVSLLCRLVRVCGCFGSCCGCCGFLDVGRTSR